jgi:hypothetical protein
VIRDDPRPDVCVHYHRGLVTWSLHNHKYPNAPICVIPHLTTEAALRAARRALRRYRKRWPNLKPPHGLPTETPADEPRDYEWFLVPEGTDDTGEWVVTA